MRIWLAVLILFSAGLARAGGSKMEFWDTQKKGANLFDSVEKPERLEAAKVYGAQFVRLAPNKWLNGRPEAELGDFLIGHGTFTAINAGDLKLLKQVLDAADHARLKVVLTMLSLPNARWKQHNNGVEERAIWESFQAQEAALAFWRQLAAELKGHPALAGYDLRNEPSPELAAPRLDDWYTGDYAGWYEKVKGTPADLNLFYRKLVKAVREVDPDTPIILESGFYATAWGFKVLDPVPDEKVLYSFHMYEPYSFTSHFNKGRYAYPGKAPLGELDEAPELDWDKAQLEKYLEPVSEWQRKYKIPSNRILAGEAGVFRTNKGAAAYLRDVTGIFNEKKWHWAFYSFREDTWDGMDYELGTGKAPWQYWQVIAAGNIPGSEIYHPNALTKALRSALKDPSDNLNP